ncbi:MAG: hypothetical protein S4CHLAM2_02770 [Chlamydiales bacterium]|nr:hypothetical protein [Chlamydiales bacterium]
MFNLILFTPLFLATPDIKETLATCQKELNKATERSVRSELHYALACAFCADQEMNRAFEHFVMALKAVDRTEAPELCAEEKKVYEEALQMYIEGGGSDPIRLAEELLASYGQKADAHPEWMHLNFLIATAWANLGKFEDFFVRFYNAYPFLGETFLAYKTRGILYLRLSQYTSSTKERGLYQKEAFVCLTEALSRNPKDGSLYKVLIFLAKDEKKDSLVLHYLQKIVENRAHVARGDVNEYVHEAVAQGELSLGQKIIDLAQSEYAFSRSVLAAQEYLNQCIRG